MEAAAVRLAVDYRLFVQHNDRVQVERTSRPDIVDAESLDPLVRLVAAVGWASLNARWRLWELANSTAEREGVRRNWGRVS